MQFLIQDNQDEILRMKQDMGEDIVKFAKDELESGDKNFTGELSGSIHVETIEGDVVVVVDSPHGMPVEFGLAPYTKVNIDALKKWVEGKLRITDPKELDNITFKIYNSIQTKGIKPTRFFKKAITRLTKGQGVKTSPKKKSNKRVKTLKKIVKTINKIYKSTRKHIKLPRTYKT